MNHHFLLIGCIGLLTSCSAPYHPLADPELRPPPALSAVGEVTITFLGNTNLLISDGSTHLLVDGFFTRPSGFKTLFGRIRPEPNVIAQELKRAGITELDAILVGHTHHDHALDTPEVARQMGHTPVMGSAAYARIHEGQNGLMDLKHLRLVSPAGGSQKFGDFKVHFTPSDHVGSHNIVQRLIEGDIERPLKVPAHYSRFKCGQVYAIHIHHPKHGDIAITTTAGAKEGQWQNRKADVLFLGIGFLTKEPRCTRLKYWRNTVCALDPDLVIPVHWDNFSIPLSEGLHPPPRLVDHVHANFTWVKNRARAEKRAIQVLGYGESVYLRNGTVTR